MSNTQNNNNKTPTSEAHSYVIHSYTETEKVYNKSFTRKNPQTGKSNYPTLQKVTTYTNNYINDTKEIIKKEYRRIIKPND